MFEDLPQKNPTPPQNLPTEPMDMFEGTEKNDNIPGPSALEAGALKKKPYGVGVQTPPPDAAGMAESYPVREPVLGKVIVIIIVLVIAGVVGYGGWRLYSYFTEPDKAKTRYNLKTEEQAVQPAGAETTTPETAEPPLMQAPTSTGETPVTPTSTTEDGGGLAPIIDEGIDTDKDGLTDAREEELGTDMNKQDTDGDNLSDGDEILIWKSNPLNPDTDGDSYLDGEEVRNGYSPTGPGKLFNGQNTATSTQPATTTTTTEPEEEEPAI